MAARRRLPDLPALLPGHERRRRRRHPRNHPPPGPPRCARRGRRVAEPRLPLAAGRQRLRHLRLRGHRPALREPRRPRRAHRGPALARHAPDDGPGGQPHERRARLVPLLPLLQGRSQARLVHLAPRSSGARSGARAARNRAHQLGLLLLRIHLGLGRGQRRVLPPPVLHQAARPELGERERPPCHLRDDGTVAGPRRGRLPHGRHQLHLQELPVGRRHQARW